MNRTIKFRGKAVKCSLFPNGEWVDGYYYEDTIAGIPRALIKCGELDVIVEPESIGQFTGLLDANGKEIYEGDILELKDNTNMDEENRVVRTEVACKDGAFGIIGEITGNLLSFFDYPVVNEIVVGNIHDNLELLEGGEK